MAVWHYTAGAHHAVYVRRGELTKGRPAQGRRSHATATTVWWAITALGLLCEPGSEVEQRPVTRWLFRHEMWPAVLRIFETRRTPLQQLLPDDIKSRVFAVIEGSSTRLHDEGHPPPEFYGMIIPPKREEAIPL